jgi:DNA-binding NarL/FixJ family response regulator
MTRLPLVLHVDESDAGRAAVARVHRDHAPFAILIQAQSAGEARDVLLSGTRPDLVLVSQGLVGDRGPGVANWMRARLELVGVAVYVVTDEPNPHVVDALDPQETDLSRLLERHLSEGAA